MAEAGQMIENPVTGERVRWLVTGADSGGALTRLELWCTEGGGVATEHVHRRATERFVIHAGALRARVGGEERVFAPGDTFVIPEGVSHSWVSAGPGELHMTVDLEPALGFEPMMETVFGLARDGKVDANGRGSLLQTAVLIDAFRDEIGLGGAAGRVVGALARVLAPIGRRRGLRAVYPRYSDAPRPAATGPSAAGSARREPMPSLR